jgi:hypothetical protein
MNDLATRPATDAIDPHRILRLPLLFLVVRLDAAE